MSQVTREINKVTGTIIGMAGRLILYAVLLMLLIEGMHRGYAFGHEVFDPTPAEAAPGRDISFTVAEGEEDGEVLAALAKAGLIRGEAAAWIQLKFYDYTLYPGTYVLNTSMTSKEILQALNVKPEEEPETEAAAENPEGQKEDTAGSTSPDDSGQEEPAETAGSQETEIRIGCPMNRGGIGI